jgi:hypothetical protein
VLVSQAARDLIVSIPNLVSGGGPINLGGGTDGNGYPTARWLTILDGSAASPVTQAAPTVKIVRTELFVTPLHNLDPGYNAALSTAVISQTGNMNQSQAIWAQATGYAAAGNYVMGGYFAAFCRGGTGGADAIFAIAGTNQVNTAAQAITTQSQNDTGVDQPHLAGGNYTVGIDLFYSAAGANYGGAAVQARAIATGGRTWDVGFAALTTSVRSAAFRDDSSAITSVVLNGAHDTLIDGSGATVQGLAFDLRGRNSLPSLGAGGLAVLYDQTPQAAGQGARLVLGGLYDSTNYTGFGAIAGRKANSTSGNFAGQLAFYVRANGGGAWTLAGYVDSDGGLVWGAATGGSKGLGTINVASGVYLNGTLYTNP